MSALPKIIIETGECRNEQIGDWQRLYDGTIRITVAEGLTPKSFFAVAAHEIVEMLLCEDKSITDFMVTRFDMQFEAERAAGKHDLFDEAGDDKRACYHDQHQAATFAERAVIAALHSTWEDHERDVNEVIKANG